MYLNNKISSQEKYITFNFCRNNKVVENGPICGMTLNSAGSMRFRWAEKNPNRQFMFEKIKAETGSKNKEPVTVELIHSQKVYVADSVLDTAEKLGDGIITKNKSLIPTITVADCVPIFLWDETKEIFGIVHSGWKGTGIIGEAITLAKKEFDCNPEDFMVIIGPHIRSCCYIVNQERRDYFSQNFTPECVEPLEENGKCYCGGKGLPITWNNGGGPLYRLSLEKANLAVLKKIGVKDENISLFSDCTCCNDIFGSNRRQTANNEIFCPQAAFIINS